MTVVLSRFDYSSLDEHQREHYVFNIYGRYFIIILPASTLNTEHYSLSSGGAASTGAASLSGGAIVATAT